MLSADTFRFHVVSIHDGNVFIHAELVHAEFY